MHCIFFYGYFAIWIWFKLYFSSYNKQYEHSIYITDISINIIQKERKVSGE